MLLIQVPLPLRHCRGFHKHALGHHMSLVAVRWCLPSTGTDHMADNDPVTGEEAVQVILWLGFCLLGCLRCLGLHSCTAGGCHNLRSLHVLDEVMAKQISKSLDNVRDDRAATKRTTRFLEDVEGLERTRQNLNEKTAQLNAAIDNVSAQLTTEEGLSALNGCNVELESAA